MHTENFTKLFLFLTFLFFGFTSFAQQALPELLYYRFDQPGTSVSNDATSPVGNNPATITGTTLSIGGVGLSGTALVGTGGTSTANAINTNWNTNLSGSFTIGFWTNNIPQTGGLTYIFGDNGANGFRCFTQGAAGAGNWLMRGGGLPDIEATGAAALTPKYTHFVYDDVAGTLTSYVDGVLSNTVTVTGFTGMTGTGFQVAAYNTTTGLDGLLDEFRIYNRALTVAEIQSTINGTIVTGPCTSANAGTATPADQTICVGNSASISAVNASFGTGASYQWESSPDGSNWTIMPNDTLPAITVSPTDTTYYRMIMTCGTSSDVSSVAVVNTQGAALNGNYTINSFALPSATNFTSFQDFFDATICGGISGPVVVDVVPGTGPYIERVEAGFIAGTSSTNTITINGNGNTLTYEASGTADRTTLNFDGTSHVIIDSLVIQATGSSHGWVMHLTNGADNNVVRNCSILASTTITGTFSAGIVASGSPTSALTYGNNTNNTVIENNFFEGGYYAISIHGAGSNNNAVGNVIRNNTIVDQRYYGIYARAQQDFEVFGNDLSRPNRDNSTIYYAMSLRNGMANARIENNRIHNTHDNVLSNTSTIYAIDVRTNTTSMSAGNPLVIANNQIYDVNGGGLLYAFYMSNSNHVKFYHNTVSIDVPNAAGSGNTRLFYTTTAADNCEFKNNILHLNRGNGGTQHMVYVNTPASAIEIDNNVYFAEELGTNPSVHIGYHSTDHTTFADWQLANSAAYDQNGLEFDPNFIGGTNPDFLRPGAGALKNLGANVQSLVPVDYDSVSRPTDPDPGAYEFTPLACTGVSDLSLDSLYPGGAIISWNSDSPEWQVEWDTCGFEPGSGIGTLQTTTNNSAFLMDSLQMGVCICVHVREICAQGGFGPWSAALEICVPIEYDAELVSLVSPESMECGDSTMNVKVEIRNNGFFPITSLPISVDITGDINQTFNTTYTGNLLEDEVDTVTLGTIDSYWGAYVNVVATVDLPNDQLRANDTLSIDSLPILSFQPNVVTEEFCPGEDSVLVEVMPFPNIVYNWFDAPTAGNIVHTGTELNLSTTSPPSLYVAFNDIADSLESTATGNTSTSNGGNMFDLDIFNTLSVTGFSVYGTTTTFTDIDVYYKVGSLQGHETNPASWILHETVSNVQLLGSATPAKFNLSNPIPMNAGQVYGIYLQPVTGSFSYASGDPLGSSIGSNADMEILVGITKAGSWTSSLSPRSWKGKVHYGSESCSDIRTPVILSPNTDTVQADFTWTTISHTVSFENTSLNADSVHWDFAGLATATGDSVSYQFPQTDSFEVCLIAYSSCGADTLCQMVWAENISVESFDNLLSLSIFPNPNQGRFELNFELENTEDIYIEFLDMRGMKVRGEHLKNHSGHFRKEYDLGNVAAGSYVLRLHTSEGIINRRVIIQ
jgi:hypothetical protein